MLYYEVKAFLKKFIFLIFQDNANSGHRRKMIGGNKKITILLSLYGQSIFWEDFFESLKQQSEQNFTLLYRFDGKRDGIMAERLAKYDFSSELTPSDAKGLPETYWELLKNAPDNDYTMFADQDDIWHADKVQCSLEAMEKAEALYGKETPILIHSDLRVVDQELSEISPSFVKHQSLNPRKKDFKSLMLQNNVTGCTVMINRALRNIVRFPEYTICHDWHLALTAAAFGKIVFADTALIDYRQHGGNVFGAVQRKDLLSKKNQRQYLHERLQFTQKQAASFLELYREKLSTEQIKYLEAWSRNLHEKSYLKRLFCLFRRNFRKHDWLRTIGMWWAI